MTTLDTIAPPAAGGWRWTLLDGWTVVRRNLLHLRHNPGEIVAMLVFPIVMIIIFGYIFGSAIPIPGGGNYREFLLPGMFAMSGAAAVAVTMQKVAADNGTGVMERFRAMPMARSAVPFGQTGADLFTGALGLIVMVACGLATGWRIHHGLPSALAAFGLVLLFGYALNWVGVFCGLMIRNEETAERLGPLFLPVTMISNTFVPTGGMPVWLRTIADWNPVSAVVAACRQLFGNPGVTAATSWPLEHPIMATVGWSAVLLLIFVPLAVYRYQTAGR
ncbi:MAG TPA: ABC transporter permease [Pseudonocardiaceae bacterium]|jgi:ABC-2 type transport system permease protein|nr:ABC transporter permease [Pseudonocardiaceae bacterium]